MFRFEVDGDTTSARFGPGAFQVASEIVMTMRDPDAARGRRFGDVLSLHVPVGSVFVFKTSPTDAGLKWSPDRSRVNTNRKIAVRIPATDVSANPGGLGDESQLDHPEDKRFTFEMDDFAVSPAGLDLAGTVRVEQVSLNGHDNEEDPDQQTKTGLKAPLAVQKA